MPIKLYANDILWEIPSYDTGEVLSFAVYHLDSDNVTGHLDILHARQAFTPLQSHNLAKLYTSL